MFGEPPMADESQLRLPSAFISPTQPCFARPPKIAMLQTFIDRSCYLFRFVVIRKYWIRSGAHVRNGTFGFSFTIQASAERIWSLLTLHLHPDHCGYRSRVSYCRWSRAVRRDNMCGIRRDISQACKDGVPFQTLATPYTRKAGTRASPSQQHLN